MQEHTGHAGLMEMFTRIKADGWFISVLEEHLLAFNNT